MSHGTAPVKRRERTGEVTGAVRLSVLRMTDGQAAANLSLIKITLIKILNKKNLTLLRIRWIFYVI
jgi:hypothetical protein